MPRAGCEPVPAEVFFWTDSWGWKLPLDNLMTVLLVPGGNVSKAVVWVNDHLEW